MPAYELSLILRLMPRAEIKSTLMRAGEAILNRNGIIRKIENLGTKDLPYKMRAHDNNHKQGSYFILHFDFSTRNVEELLDQCNRDIDIIKPKIMSKAIKIPDQLCTLEEEFLPPALRPSITKLLAQSIKRTSKYPLE